MDTGDLFDNRFDVATNSDARDNLSFNNSGNDTIVTRRFMFAMANTKFATIWWLIDSDKKLQNTFISALNQFIDWTRQNKTINIQSWGDNNAPDNLTQNTDRPVPGMVLVLPNSRSTGRYKGAREHRQVV